MPVVIPTSKNLTKDINSKLLLPIGVNDLCLNNRPSTSKSLVDANDSDDNTAKYSNIELNVEPPAEENEENEVDEENKENDPKNDQTVMISFDKIFGAFCKRIRKKRNTVRHKDSSRNCIEFKDNTKTLKPIRLSRKIEGDSTRACSFPFPLGSNLFKSKLTERNRSIRNSFQSDTLSVTESNFCKKDRYKKFHQTESCDLNKYNTMSGYSSYSDDCFNEPESSTIQPNKVSLFKTSVNFPRHILKTKILNHSYMQKQSTIEGKKRKQKICKIKLYLNEIHKKKNVQNINVDKRLANYILKQKASTPANFMF